MAIKISVSGLAKFMKSGPASQRTLLKTYKFTTDKNGNKRPQIVRYSEARAAIKKYHESGNDVATLLAAVTALQKKEATIDPEKDTSRIQDNIRAIEAYMKHFSKNNFVVLDNPKPKYTHGGVEVSASPDLYVDDAGTKKMIKLDFNSSPLDIESIKIILKVMHEASLAKNLDIAPKDVIYLDVSRNEQHGGAKLNKQLKKDIDAACETIEDIWPKVKQ
jgi:hypothetical protein